MQIQVRENLSLRPRTIKDAPQVFEVIDKGRKYLREWLLWVDSTVSVEDIELIIKQEIENEQKDENFSWGIFWDNDFIGRVAINSINKFSDSAQIGYWLAEEWQGKGIMTDCVRAVTDYCFNELNLNSVVISCADGNKKSRAIPERLKFGQWGVLQECMKYYGVYYDEVIYGVVKKNWNKSI
jgi:ribosomal-protein-serine acetyltransferase